MKNKFLIIVFAFQSLLSIAQFPSQEFVGISASKSSTTSTQVSSATGQNVIGSGASDNCIINQGYIQSKDVLIDTLPYYNIGEIPDQIVYQEVPLVFYFWSKDLGLNAKLSIEVIDPKPAGEIKFNPITKRFAFKAASTDKGEFKVIFQGILDVDTVSQEVILNIFPDLPPEQTAFGLTPNQNTFPSDSDDSNIIITKSSLGAGRQFNHQSSETFEHSIAGKTLIFDENLSNKLQIYCNNPRYNIESLNLYAEKIIIRSPIYLPQTEVHIQSRELIFEGDETTAYINTKPVDPTIIPGMNEGINGLDAGPMTLFVNDFIAQPGKRFKLYGGKAGPSPNGLSRAGNAGNGGNFISNKELSGFADLAPGEASNSGNIVGDSGTRGNFLLEGSRYSWINPFALRLVIAHSRSAYLNGFDLEAKEICDNYTSEIDDYTAISAWDSLSSETQVEILQLSQEMATTSQRIASNLDFYGNPAGWVPMLSFEVNKNAFEEEVNRAINVLYFCYWIQKENASREQQLSALQTAQTELQGLLNEYQNDYIEAATLLPQVENKAQNISDEIDILLDDLEELEVLLLERATYANIPKKENLWRKITRTVGRIAQVVPIYQPALGAIGTGLVTVSEIDFSKPWDAIESISGVVGDIAKTDWKTSADDYKGVIDSIKLLNVKHDTVDRIKIAGVLIKKASPLVNTIKDLTKKAEETGISSEKIDATLAKLKADSPEYSDLISRTEVLNMEKVQFLQEINTLLQSLSNLGNNIQQGVLSIDAMNLKANDLGSVRNLRAMIYTKDMENRVKERLLKYHYYMKKAYEYRLLTPYPADLTLPDLFDEYLRFVDNEDEDNTVNLTQTEFSTLKAVYDDVLSTVTDEILNIYNTNAPEISAPLRFSLTDDDLRALNNQEPVLLNMVKRGMFPAYEENIRIRSFKVVDVKMHFENGQPGSFAYFDMLMEHSGISRLKKTGETYLFNHYNEQNTNPIVWGSRFDAAAGLLNPKEPSPSATSLLYSILENLNRYSPENHLLYSRPAAWADILISKNDVTSNGVKMVVDSMTFEVVYDFSQLPTNYATVNVITNDNLRPYISLTKEDINERQDGWGNFNRTFFQSTTGKVEMEAPEEYGAWVFENWTDQFGNLISDKNKVEVTFSQSQTVKANYTLIQPVLHLPQDTIFVPNEVGSQLITVENIGTGDMDWYSTNTDSWLKIVGDSTGFNNGNFEISFDENTTGNQRIQELYVVAPSSIDYIDTIVVIQDIISSIESKVKKKPTISLIPNPVQGELFIKFSGITPHKLQIFDLTGKKLKTIEIEHSDQYSIDVSSLIRGTYILVAVDHKNNRYQKRFVKI